MHLNPFDVCTCSAYRDKDFPDLQLDDADGDDSEYTISLPIGWRDSGYFLNCDWLKETVLKTALLCKFVYLKNPENLRCLNRMECVQDTSCVFNSQKYDVFIKKEQTVMGGCKFKIYNMTKPKKYIIMLKYVW